MKKYLYDTNDFAKLNDFLHQKKYSKIFILTDSNTRKYCLPVVSKHIDRDFTNVNISNGDTFKNMETLSAVWDDLLRHGADRKSLLINLGGGVVTDLGGFAAVTFKRGIDFMHIPTSLLGMVDAAIGGKNGINYRTYKNQIGTIVPPAFVLLQPLFLETLPQNEWMSGFAEMLKHGLIADPVYWNELIRFVKHPADAPLLPLIQKSVEIKDRIITTDPYEKGLRKILNFGHTLGHAIETYVNYTRKQALSHGHAVAIGMILAAYLSTQLTGLPASDAYTIKNKLQKLYPVLNFTYNDIQHIIDLLIYDKKNENGRVNFVLLEQIGVPVWDQKVPEKLIWDAFSYYSS